MEPIYDRRGRAVAWLNGNTLFDPAGGAVAFLSGSALFTHRPRYLGRLDRGFFRDAQGRAVAFLSGASDGPPLPVTTLAPVPPIPAVAPAPPATAPAPVAPACGLDWSVLSWDGYIGSGRA